MDNSQILKEEGNDGRELGDNTLKENKSPGRIIYFANGETMEEYSSEEDDVEEENQKPLLDTANLSWGNYLRSWALQIVATAFFACEFLGGKFVTFLGLNEAKYQYAVDEYYRKQNKKNESDEDGEEMPKRKETSTSNEKYNLEMKQLRYGSINCNDIPFLPQKDTVANVNELEEAEGYTTRFPHRYGWIANVIILSIGRMGLMRAGIHYYNIWRTIYCVLNCPDCYNLSYNIFSELTTVFATVIEAFNIYDL